MDQIDYVYGSTFRNQLTSINDPKGIVADTDIGGASTYTYDRIGNLISDTGEEIKKIEWTVSGKVKSVIREEGSEKSNLEFFYDAMGNRVMKVETLAETTKTIVTWYSRDASGNVMATYKSPEAAIHTTANVELTELPIYGSSRFGMLTVNTKVGNMETLSDKGSKYFELSNHLGNVLSVVSDKLSSVETSSGSGIVNFYTADIVSSTDYYPFGMPMPGRGKDGPPNAYCYGFQGQEKDDEMGKGDGNSYDFGARLYDPRLGRWLAVDPLAAKFPFQSPYVSFSNKPIINIDPDGNADFYYKGKRIASDGKNDGLIVAVTWGKVKRQIKRAARKAGKKNEALDFGHLSNGDKGAGYVVVHIDILNEAYSVMSRSITEGVDRELSSSMTQTNYGYKVTDRKIGDPVDIKEATFALSAPMSYGGVTIHSHLTGSYLDLSGSKPISKYFEPIASLKGRLGVNSDENNFPKSNMNIIVGKLGEPTVNRNENGDATSLTDDRVAGMTIYGGTLNNPVELSGTDVGAIITDYNNQESGFVPDIDTGADLKSHTRN